MWQKLKAERVVPIMKKRKVGNPA